MLSSDDPRHGTRNGYVNLGCRCERCRAAHADAQKTYMAAHPEQRAKHNARGTLQPWHHGKQTGYARGCRCEACRTAHSDYNKRWHEARRASLRSLEGALPEGSGGAPDGGAEA